MHCPTARMALPAAAFPWSPVVDLSPGTISSKMAFAAIELLKPKPFCLY